LDSPENFQSADCSKGDIYFTPCSAGIAHLHCQIYRNSTFGSITCQSFSNPARVPALRRTLVAPIFPLPLLRMSSDVKIHVIPIRHWFDPIPSVFPQFRVCRKPLRLIFALLRISPDSIRSTANRYYNQSPGYRTQHISKKWQKQKQHCCKQSIDE